MIHEDRRKVVNAQKPREEIDVNHRNSFFMFDDVKPKESEVCVLSNSFREQRDGILKLIRREGNFKTFLVINSLIETLTVEEEVFFSG